MMLACVQASFGQLSGALSGTLGPGTYHIVGNISINSGDTLVLAPGTTFHFDGTYKFDINGTLIAEGTESDLIIFTTDTGTNPARWRGLRFHSSATVSMLVYCLIENSYAPAYYYGGGVYCEQGTSPSFTSCTICNNTADDAGDYFGNGGGVYCGQWASPDFEKCIIINNTGDDNGGGGVCCWTQSSPTFTNCVIADNSAGSYGGGGVYCAENSSPVFTHCTVSGNEGSSAGGVYCWSTLANFRSTIFAYSIGRGIYFDNSPWCQVRYCDFFGNSGGNFAGSAPAGLGQLTTANANGDPCDQYYNIFLDPLFVAPPTSDMHLIDFSPCIGAAQAGGASDDIEYNPRPSPPGSYPDIGAYENGYSVPTVPPVDSLVISFQSGDAILNWPDTGSPSFNIYGSTYPFVTGTLLDTTTDTIWTDMNTATRPSPYFYYVTAVE